MKTEITYPKNELLKRVIQFVIFIEKDDFETTSQICYPNTNYCLSIMQNSKFIKNSDIDYTVIKSDNNESYLTGIYKNPIRITAKTPYREVCINFNPFGLELIFNQNFSTNEFKGDILKYVEKKYKNALNDIVFSDKTPKLIQEEIESFFLEIIKDESNVKDLIKINTINELTSIEEIEDVLCKSNRSTHRYFKQNLNISPKKFVDIKRIRKGMDLLLMHNKTSEIATELDFTDASHFIKTFKKFTYKTPLEFKNETTIVDDTLIWKLE